MTKRKEITKINKTKVLDKTEKKVKESNHFKDPYIDSDESIQGSDDENNYIESDDDLHIQDEPESDTEEVEETKDSQPSKKKRKVNEKALHRLPTTEEMNSLKETSDLFKSNLFKLQINELLKEVNINYQKTKPIQTALHTLKGILDTMKPIGVKSLQDAKKSVSVEIPFPHPAPKDDSNIKFEFKAPKNVAVVGSFLLQTMAKSPEDLNVDLAVEMPTELFQEKDHMNYRYFYKRAYYLAVLAARLSENKPLKWDLKFKAFQNDPKRPILVIKSTEKSDSHFSKKGWQIRIFPYISSSFFAKPRLSPKKNCVRPENKNNDELLPSTPHYNNAVLSDSYYISHMNIIHSHIKESPAFKDAIILSKVWIAQRGLSDSSRNGFGLNGYLISMIMGWLLRFTGKSGTKKIGQSFSCYQMLKITIDFIAKHDFSKSPLFLTDNGEALDDSEFSADAFLEKFDVAIVDPTGTVNLAGHITKTAMQEIQYEARLTLEFINEVGTDRFDDIFLRKVDQPWLKYDNLFRIPAMDSHITAYSKVKALDHNNMTHFSLRHLGHILSTALTDRVTCLSVSSAVVPMWSVNEQTPDLNIPQDITIGMVLHAENSLRQVEHGPSAEDQDLITKFRALWGNKAELRRFQDGSITESVVFECDGTVSQRSLLVARMTTYLLERHFKVNKASGVTFWAGLGNEFLSPVAYPEISQSFQPIMSAFESLSKELRALDLPLAIHDILPRSDSLTYSSVFFPQPNVDGQLSSLAHPADFLIEFEASGKWPDDIQAIETMKKAFYIRIVTAISDSGSDTRARVCVGEGNESFLDITHSSGHFFRAKIQQTRVISLLEKALKASPDKSKPQLQTYLKKVKRDLIHKPQHASQISNLCLRYPFLGNTIRLAKRWVSSHLLLSPFENGIAPELIEIICSRIFVTPTTFGIPSSGWTGFVRFLDLLQSWKWSSEPLIVQLGTEKVSVDLTDEIKEKFLTLSNAGVGHISMFVATDLDPDSSIWGSLNIPVKIVQRLVLLAKTALQHIKSQILVGTDNDVTQLFITPSTGYNAIIHLDCEKLINYFDSVSYDDQVAPKNKSKFKNIQSKEDLQLQHLRTINPVEHYMKELITYYKDIAYFFYDMYGGDKIVIVWKPGQLEETPFKLNVHYNFKPMNDKGKLKLQVNKMAILGEIQRLGHQLVLGIEII
ncbi:Nrap protein [Globomyces pollinis-pini]|nr:Nrap protein [Globomyces pollinis-pini]